MKQYGLKQFAPRQYLLKQFHGPASQVHPPVLPGGGESRGRPFPKKRRKDTDDEVLLFIL